MQQIIKTSNEIILNFVALLSSLCLQSDETRTISSLTSAEMIQMTEKVSELMKFEWRKSRPIREHNESSDSEALKYGIQNASQMKTDIPLSAVDKLVSRRRTAL